MAPRNNNGSTSKTVEPVVISHQAVPPPVRMVPPEKLTPHPRNREIYGDQLRKDLVESIRERGVLEPILATPDNVVLAGCERLAASLATGRKEVPVIIVTPGNENEEIDIILAGNSQRVKTNEQVAREAEWRMRIAAEKARARQSAGGAGRKVTAKSPEAGEARAIVAKQMGMGAKKVDQCVAVVRKMNQLKEVGRSADEASLRDLLNKSANRAAKRVMVLDARDKVAGSDLATEAELDDGQAPVSSETKGEIISRLQDDLAEVVDRWPIEQLRSLESELTRILQEWKNANSLEVAS